MKNLGKSEKEQFFIFDGEKGENKLFVINKNGELEYSWQRENERCSILLEPLKPRSNRAWIILTNSNIKHIDKAMTTAQAFLEYGDFVIITTDTPKNTVEKYENKFELWHEHSASEKHKFSGHNVNCVACVLLVSEALAVGEDGDLFDIIIECGGTVANAEWGDLPDLAINESMPFPLDSLPAELASLVDTIAKGRKVSSGFVANILLGVIALLAKGYYIDSMPLTSYFLTVAGTGAGKSSIMDYLIEPLRILQDERVSMYLDEMQQYKEAEARRKSKTQDKDEAPLIEPIKPTPLYFDQLNFSAQGLIIELMKNDIALQNSEARTVFYSNAFNHENREYSFGVFCRLWEGKSPAYRTRDISADVRPNALMMMNLAIQDDVYFDVIANNDSYFKSGFLPRFLTYHAPQKDYNDVAPRLAFQDLFEKTFDYNPYEKYAQRLRKILEEKPRKFATDSTIRSKIEAINIKYDMLRSDSNPNHAIYRRFEVAGFLDRCSQHAQKLAGILAVWQEKDRIGIEDLDNASRIVDFYLSEVIKQCRAGQQAGVYTDLLNGLYQLSKDDKNTQAPLVSTSLIQQRKIVRDSRNKNQSIKRDELSEHLSVLADLGFVILKQKGNKTLVKLHPKYRP